MGNLVTLEETHMNIYADDKINGPASKRNAALFPTIWPTSSKTHLHLIYQTTPRSTSYNKDKVFQLFFPLPFKATTLPSTTIPSTHQPINPSALVNSSTCCAASAKERKSTADWCPEVHSSAAAERTLATLPGKTRGRMSYMTCLEVRFQGQQKRYMRSAWMNNIQYIVEEKLWNLRRLPSENPPESCAFSKPTKVLSNHPLIIENVLQ